MSEDLTSFDVSHLDALAKLEADQHAIQELLEKAAWRRDKELEVYSRVMADYQVRMTAILEQANAVRQQVRDGLRKVELVHDRYREALDQATVQLQECEFRREIGEFTPEEFQRCQQAAQRTIGEREAEFESVRKLRLRYIELLPGEPVSQPPAHRRHRHRLPACGRRPAPPLTPPHIAPAAGSRAARGRFPRRRFPPPPRVGPATPVATRPRCLGPPSQGRQFFCVRPHLPISRCPRGGRPPGTRNRSAQSHSPQRC